MKKWTNQKKMEYCMKLQKELTDMYILVNQLFIICMDRGLKLILENPFSEEHYLRRYWCIVPDVIDKDRRLKGDYFKKPTQYWFVNCKPKNNFIFEPVVNNRIKKSDPNRFMKYEDYKHTGAKHMKTARSMIHPDYANRFIREYIIENE